MLVCTYYENNKFYIQDSKDKVTTGISISAKDKLCKYLDIENLNYFYVGYKFRLYPNKSQIQILNKNFGCVRKVWNLMLEDRKTYYEYFSTSLNNNYSEYLENYPYLYEADSLALAKEKLYLDTAFKRYFKGESEYPNFKNKHSKQSYTTNLQKRKNKIITTGNSKKNRKIYLPKIGYVKLKVTRYDFNPNDIRELTVSKDRDEKYYVSFHIKKRIENLPYNSNELGIDLGIKNIIIDSNGVVYPNNKYYYKYNKKLVKEQRKLSKKKKGSNNYRKQKLKIARLHKKIANSRLNNIHNNTTKIIRDNQIIISEDLNTKGMLKNHKLAKAISDVSFGEIVRQLNYKSNWYGRLYIKVDRYFPSSQLCNNCNNKNPKVKNLKIRV